MATSRYQRTRPYLPRTAEFVDDIKVVRLLPGLLEGPVVRSQRPIVRPMILASSPDPMMAAVSWTTGERTWNTVAQKAAPYAGAILSRSPEQIAQRVREIAGNRDLSLPPSVIAQQLVACEIETAMQMVRSHAPTRWVPEIIVEGKAHLDSALATGRGAILWDSHFYFASLITKMGLYRDGYRLHHMSRREHGFSLTHFGIRVLNPVRTSIEARYLAVRVVMLEDNPVPCWTILRRLADNEVVSVTVRGDSNRPVEAPFLDGAARIAPGAPVLAWNSQSALLPVFTKRIDNFHYRVRISPPINVLDNTTRRDAVVSAAQEYARRLEAEVIEHPGQWIDWINI